MKSKLLLIAVMLLMVFSTSAATIAKATLLNAYQVAERNHRSNPNLAIELWANHYQHLGQLPADIQYNWHIFTTIAYIENNQFVPALDIISQTVAMPAINKPANRIKVFNLLGVIYTNLKQHPKAILAWQCALPHIDNPSMIKARLLNNIAITLVEQNKLSQALTYYQQAIQLATLHNNNQKLALYSGNLGYAFMVSGQSQNALRYLKKAIFLREKYHYIKHKAKTSLFLLHTLIDIQDWQSYDRYYNRIAQTVQQLQDKQWTTYFELLQDYTKLVRHHAPLNKAQKQQWQQRLKYQQLFGFHYKVATSLELKLDNTTVTNTYSEYQNQAASDFIAQCHQQQ